MNTEVKYNYLELAPAGDNRSFCLGSDIQLNAVTLSGADYAWSGPDGFTSNVQNPPLITNAQSTKAGTYTLTYTLNGCSVDVPVTIGMNQLPTGSTINVDQDWICPGNSTSLSINNTDASISYQLQDNLGNNIGTAQVGNGGTLTFPTGNLMATTDFQFYYQFTLTGCNSISNAVTIHVRTNPATPIAVNDTVCNGGNMTVSVSGGNIYHWYNTASGGTPIVGLEGISSYSIDTNVTQTFYVSTTDVFGCESDRTPVTAFVHNPLNPPVDLLSGLILHYKFNGDTKDYSGNGYDATIMGTSSFVEDHNGNINSAINSITTSTPGNNYLDVGNPQKVEQLTNQVTVAMWIRQTQTWYGSSGDNGYMPLLNKINASSTGLYVGLHMTNATTNRVIWQVNANNYTQSSVNVPVGKWHYIVCTYDGAKLRIYQNGSLSATANCTGNIGNTFSHLLLGKLANGNGDITYRGDWDEVKIYNRVLNADEIKTLYNDESVAFSNAPFCDGEGNLELTTFAFPNASYQWSGPNGFTSTFQNPTPIVNADSATYAGTYNLQVTVDGCTSPLQSKKVIIYQFPNNPMVLNDTVCGSGNATLTASGAPSDGIYVWYTSATGGTPISGQNDSTLIINNLSATTSRYVAISRNGCETDRVEVKAVLMNAVDKTIAVNGSDVCEDETSGQVIIPISETGVNYQAFLGANAISSSYTGNGNNLTIPIDVTGMSVGNNTVTIKANHPSCGAEVLNNTVTVVVHPLPSVTITANGPTQFCQGDAVDLTATTANAYLWSTNETTSSIHVTSSGNYTVTVTDNNHCQNSASLQIIVDTPPTVSIVANGNTTICEGDSVQFVASGGTSYLWNTNETTTSIYAKQGGAYHVTAYNGTCASVSSDIQLTVNSAPNVSINANNTAVCEGDSVILSGVGAATYSWTNGISDGEAFIPTGTTQYTVTGTDGNNCQAIASISITVHPLPDATFTADSPTLCPNVGNLTLTANNSNLAQYDWYLDGNVFQMNGGYTQTINAIGVYKLEVKDGNNCVNYSTLEIQQGTVPDLTISADDTVFCSNSSDLISADLLSGASYSWYHDGNMISSPVVEANTYSATTGGDYSVQVVNTDGCASVSNTVTITSIAPPTATITTTNTTLCTGSSTLISANLVSGAMYEWFLNNVSLGTAQLEQNTFNATATGDYTVQITINCSAISNRITLVQGNSPNSAGTINGSTQFCTGNSNDYSINNVNGATNYLWEVIPANAASISGQGTTNVTVNTTNQNFTLKVTPQNSCGNGTATSIAIQAGNSQIDCPPDVYFYANSTNICQGSSVVFTNATTMNNPSLTPKWNFGSGANPATATGQGPITVTYSTPGLKTVTLNYTDAFDNPYYSLTKTDYITVCGSIVTSTITGTAIIACNSTDEIYSVENTVGSTYQWTVPQGASILSGQGTNNIHVYFNGNDGNIQVQETNATGCVGTAVTFDVTIDNTVNTSSISGHTNVDCQANNEVYSVTNSTGSTYQWSVPQGATIINGQGTNNIHVNFNGNFGVISVIETSQNGCVGQSVSIQVDCNLGIDEEAIQNVTIYPNPTMDVFQIVYDGNESAEVILYEINGKVIKHLKVKSNEFIDIHELSKSVYFGKLIINHSQAIPFKIIKD